ncbi:MAG: L,D-transpeptidase family protein, partial [Actinomycetales bacterium]
GSKVRDLEARLAQRKLLSVRWVDGTFGTATRSGVVEFQAAKGLAKTGEVDQATWDALRAATHTPTHDELYPKVTSAPVAGGRLDPRCLEGRVLCIDKTTRTLAWVVDGSVQKRIAVRFGSQFTPTREGVFDVYRKDADHVSNLFGSKMPYAMFFSRGQAVHFSSDFAARGYAGASHGCVNTRDKGATAWIFGQVHIGDAVVVYHSSQVTSAPTTKSATPAPTKSATPAPTKTSTPSPTKTTTPAPTKSSTPTATASASASGSTAVATGSATAAS